MAKQKAFQAILDLGEETVEELEQRMLDGQKDVEIVAWLHSEKGALLNKSPESLARTLSRYRRDVIRPRELDRVVKRNRGTSTHHLRKKTDTLERLRTHLDIQEGRFHKAYDKEKNSPLLMEQVTKEGEILRKGLIDLAKLEMEVGVIPRAPRTTQGTMTSSDGTQATFTWTEQDARLLEELDESVTEGHEG